MNMIISAKAFNRIAMVVYFGTPIIIFLLIWIGKNLKDIKNKLDNK